MRDIKSNLLVKQSLAPASRTAAGNGTGVDLAGYEGAMVVIDCGTAGGTTPSFEFEVKESADNSTYTAVADGDLIGTEPTVTTANDDGVFRIGYIGNKQYIRCDVKAVSGTSPTLVCAAQVVLGRPRKAPVD